MKFVFEPMSLEHSREIMDIYNYYVENSYAAYPDRALPYEFYPKFLDMTKGYPAYTILEEGRVVGFCFLHAYNPFPSFKECAEITYFIDKDFTGKGIGKAALERLEAEAAQKGIKRILANISSLNNQSLSFHLKNGFRECGRLEKIITKQGKQFDVVWMQKDLI
jgi:phosphinothricin acetyltransferase